MSRFIEARVLCCKAWVPATRAGMMGGEGGLRLWTARLLPRSVASLEARGPEWLHPHASAMRQGSVVFRLHFDQPRGGAGEFEGFSAGVGLVERFGRG